MNLRVNATTGRAIKVKFNEAKSKVCLNRVPRVTGKIIEALKGTLSRGQLGTEAEL